MSDEPPAAYRPHDGSSGSEESGPSPTFQADAMGATVIAYLVTGPAVFGGIGWLLAQWLGISAPIPVGILLGMALSLYIIWLRYGRT
jgi:ATP synthase protein I